MAILKKPPKKQSDPVGGKVIIKQEIQDFSNWKNTLYSTSIAETNVKLEGTKKKIMKCNICDEEYENLVTHFITRHKESDLKSLSDINTVVHEIENSKQVSIVNCSIEEMKNHKCDFCGEIFFQPKLLQNHIQTVHEKEGGGGENSKPSFNKTTCFVKILPKISNHEEKITVSFKHL